MVYQTHSVLTLKEHCEIASRFEQTIHDIQIWRFCFLPFLITYINYKHKFLKQI